MSKSNMYYGNKGISVQYLCTFYYLFFSIYHNIFISPPIYSFFHAKQLFKMGILFLLDVPEMIVFLRFSKGMCQRYTFLFYILNYGYVVAKQKNKSTVKKTIKSDKEKSNIIQGRRKKNKRSF